jgi:hypothetical protein
MQHKSPSQKLHQLQKQIFTALQAQADLLLGEMPASIRKYEKECQKDFSIQTKTLRTLKKDELLARVLASDVTFIADFHTFDQTQRTALRIMREAFSPDTRWLIGLELVPSHHQEALDRFQRGELTEAEFHAEISYAEEWGFPWENYRPLFDWARENEVRMIALNRPKALRVPREEKELHDRDQWAAGIITDLFVDHFKERNTSKGPEQKMIVLYGELHVGSAHLPAQLEQVSRRVLVKPLSWITVHQNQAKLYWKLIAQKPEFLDKTVVLKKGIYCVFSATPWAKLQSLVNWAENDLSDPIADPLDTQVDYLSLIKTYGLTLSDFLGVAPPSFGDLTVCTIDEANCLEDSRVKKLYSREELQLIRFLVTTNRSLYLARAGIAYLGSPSHHRAAEMAAIHTLNLEKVSAIFERSEEGFYRNVLLEAFAYFGSMILNPHRKCDLPTDHRHRLRNLNRGEKEAFPREKKARTLVLELLGGRKTPTLKKVLSDKKLVPVALMAARFQGKILGKRLHQALLAEKTTLPHIREIFFHGPTLSYRTAYLEVLRISRYFSENKSKKDSL